MKRLQDKRHQGWLAAPGSRRGAAPECPLEPQKEPALSTPDLRLPASRLWESTFLLLKPPSLRDFVTAAGNGLLKSGAPKAAGSHGLHWGALMIPGSMRLGVWS